jgi:beta-ureidopropionase
MAGPAERGRGGATAGGRRSQRVTAVAVQTGPAGPDLEDNLRAAGKLAHQAGAAGAILVFPELFSRPFWCLGLSDPGFFSWAEPVTGPTVTFAADLAVSLRSVVVAPFFERGPVPGEYYNSAAVLGPDGRMLPGRLPDGSPVSVYRKHAVSAYRWGEQVNDEKFYFRPGSGLPVFDTPLGRIGVLICLDRWFPEAWRVLALRGAEVVCVVNASSGDADDLNAAVLRAGAAQNVVGVIAVNRAGREEVAGRRADYYGRSCVIDPAGRVLAGASEAEAGAMVAGLDLEQVTAVRERRTMYRDRRPELYGPITEVTR